MTSRREFMKSAAAGATTLSLAPRAAWAKPDMARPPMRFVFLHRGNGLFPKVLVPPSLSSSDADKDTRKEPLNIDSTSTISPSG